MTDVAPAPAARQTLTLRFVTSNDAISAMIRFAEYGFWASHVETLSRDEKGWLGAHVDGGVETRALDYDAGTRTHELRVNLTVTQTQSDAFFDFLEAQIGKKYDITAIEAFVARRDWQEPDSWFCSELIGAALVASGWFASPLATTFNHITPRDLLLIISGRVALPEDTTP